MSEPLLPLSLYAAVTAALGEGHALAEILEHEGISEDEWEAGEEEWVERLDDSAESDLALFDDLQRELAAQRARFARKIAPLDDDVDAYLAFQRHLAAAERPAPWLAQHGLFLGDWVRLQERWAERFSKDPEARARAGVLLSSTGAAPLPELRPEPRKRPPPVRPRLPPPVAVETDGVEVQDEPLEWGLSLLRGDPATLGVAAPGATAPSPRPPPPPPPDVSAPAPAPPAAIAALPTFMRAQAPLAGAAVSVVHSVHPETPTRLPIPISPATPIAPGPASSGVAKGRADEGETLDEAPDSDEPSTIIGASPIPEDLALPFRPAAPGARPIVAPVRAPPTPDPREAPQREGVEHATAEAQPSPLARSALPFRPQRPAAPATPAAATRSPATPAAHAVGAAPGAVAAGTTARAADLTLEQYAAMCAALAVFPERADAIFARHDLADPVRRAAVDAAWKGRLARYPSERAEWERRYWQWEASWRRAGWR